MKDFDVLIVGSGINSLVCGAELTAMGRRVLILERAPVAGGCIKTDEITVPGFRHDLFSTSYPLFVTSSHYPSLKPLLDQHGLRFVRPPLPTGVLLPDGRWTAMGASRAKTVQTLNEVAPGDGNAFDRAMNEVEANAAFIFGLLTKEPRAGSTIGLLAREVLREGLDGLSEFGSDGLMSLRAWLESAFASDLSRALIAPWVLHAGLGPEATASGLVGKVILYSLDVAGNPFVEGGGDRIVKAFTAIIEEGEGTVITSADVVRVNVSDGVAVGVSTRDGKTYRASRAVVCNVTPPQLYGMLLPTELVPKKISSRAMSYRFGHACMQIHIALSEAPKWSSPELSSVGFLHLTPGLDAVSRAVNEADRGLLPAEATIVVGQPIAADPSRCPPGASILWLQLQELPTLIRGDALEVLPIPADGRWNDDIALAYADRILGRLRSHISNLDTAMLGTRVLGPHELERHNINLVGGDPYSGSCALDQFYLFRPFGGAHNHRTPIKNLFHIGASTHPGPGLGGVSGHLVAQEIG